MADYISNNWDDGEGGVEVNSPEFEGDSNKSEVKAISNAGQALDIARRLEWNDRQRDIRRARILAAFNGEAPYSQSELINKAQGYRYNVSFGYTEGVVGRGLVPYNDLTLEIGNLTEIEADLPDEKRKILELEFARILDEWGQWPKVISRLNQDLVLNGYNCFLFPSDYDPFPIFVAQKDGYVDEGTPNSLAEVELFVWKKSYLIHELYQKIGDPEIAEKAGWNVENVRQALMGAQSELLGTSNTSQSGNWTQIESLIRGGSMWASMIGAKKVNTYHVFAAELDGKVTQYIVMADNQTDANGGTELFKKEKRFNDIRDILVYFDLETGDGTWHGSKGLGQRVFNTHKALDKIRCSLLDQAFVSGLTLIQPGDQLSQEELTLSVIGPFAVIPAGLTIAANTLPAISSTSFQVDALLVQTGEQRVGDVIPNAQATLQAVSKTATQAKIDASQSLLITQGNLKRYVDPISQTTSIMVKRLIKKNSPNPYAKKFQERLKARGITDEDLKKIRRARNTGKIADVLGETAQKTQIIFAEFRGDPEVDQHRLKEMRIGSVLDAEAADDLLITDEDQTKQIESARMQELENTTLQTGVKVPVSARDNHEIHLKVIFELAGTMIQQQAQAFNEQVIPVLQNLLAHAKQHEDFLARDKTKKNTLKQYEDGVKTLEQGIKDLQKQAAQLAKNAIDQAAKLARTPEEMAQVEQARAQLPKQATQPVAQQ